MTVASLPKRDRVVLLSSLAAVAMLSWAYLWRIAHDPMTMCMANMRPWTVGDLSALFWMWAIMMIAMMIPAASPMILAFAGVNRARREQSLSYVSTSAFVLGYAGAWTIFSLAATLAQEALHSAALLSSMGTMTSNTAGGALLAGTGVFQFTPLKDTCLRHCRSPLGFILTEWRDGTWGALQMGLHQGLYCVGCCWLLMGLLFVAGVMNLWWVAAIAGFVLLEKVAGAGLQMERITGLLLIVWGGWVLARALV